MSFAPQSSEIDRQTMEVDIACAGFGPAMEPEPRRPCV